jgi:hypothetical protein
MSKKTSRIFQDRKRLPTIGLEFVLVRATEFPFAKRSNVRHTFEGGGLAEPVSQNAGRHG